MYNLKSSQITLRVDPDYFAINLISNKIYIYYLQIYQLQIFIKINIFMNSNSISTII